MATFVVEVYMPPSRAQELDATIRRLGESRSSDFEPAAGRYVRSTFVPEDEVCFHVFEAASAEAVRDVGSRLSLNFDRVVEAHESGSDEA